MQRQILDFRQSLMFPASVFVRFRRSVFANERFDKGFMPFPPVCPVNRTMDYTQG
jgi:hypothetical protein